VLDGAVASEGAGKQLSARATLGVLARRVLEINATTANAFTLRMLPAFSLDVSSLFQQVG
jgi:hypothetical protein